MLTGQWAESTTNGEDIKRSLNAAFEAILDGALRYPEPATMTVIIGDRQFHMVKTWYAREMWREKYRAARVLGNRELAFEFIGERRRF